MAGRSALWTLYAKMGIADGPKDLYLHLKTKPQSADLRLPRVTRKKFENRLLYS